MALQAQLTHEQMPLEQPVEAIQNPLSEEPAVRRRRSLTEPMEFLPDNRSSVVPVEDRPVVAPLRSEPLQPAVLEMPTETDIPFVFSDETPQSLADTPWVAFVAEAEWNDHRSDEVEPGAIGREMPYNEHATDSMHEVAADLHHVLDGELVATSSAPDASEHYFSLSTQLESLWLAVDSEQQEQLQPLIDELRIQLEIDSEFPEESQQRHIAQQQRLEECCAPLFESLGLAYDEAVIEKFLGLLQTEESPVIAIDREETAVNISSRGTHERKVADTALIPGTGIHVLTRKLQPYLLIGSYATQESLG